MSTEKASHTPIICSDRGWVLMYALVFCVAVQGIALITCSLVAHNMKSSTAFTKMLSRRHIPAGIEEEPVFRHIKLHAPEGWDHSCFCTDLTEKAWGDQCRYSWRIRLRGQPDAPKQTPMLSGWRPHVILLVDDGQDMLTACGCPYRDDSLYLVKPDGEIVPAQDRDDVASSLSTPSGTFFRGDYGNLWHQADDTYFLGGTMPCWTFVIESLKEFIDSMDLCPMAVATVSGGIVQSFTTDRALLFSTLEGLRPQAADSALSESLLGLLTAFPDGCSTTNHVIVATDGIAVGDGDIPSWLQDYDHDGDPDDRAIAGEGSHCLDDVAAYARSQGVSIHVMGPDTPFLTGTADKGGGILMPEAGAFDPPASLVTLPHCVYGDARRPLTNIDMHLSPPWVDWEDTRYYKCMVNDLPHLSDVSTLEIKGTALSAFVENGTLLCTTSRENLMSIDTATGACPWMAEGVGGKVIGRGGLIIAGPDIRGDIVVLGDGPQIRWLCPGDLFTASEGSLYSADGAVITAHTLVDGFFEAAYTADSAVCALEYDPCRGVVLAASQTGRITLLGQDLAWLDLLFPNLQGEIRGIRSFHSRHELHVIALAERRAACLRAGDVLWSRSLEAGTITNAVVMDSKLYLSAWEPGECGGIDTGESSLVVLDALTGDTISRAALFGSKAYGPVIDPDAGIIEHISWDMSIHRTDISDLPGLSPCDLGTRIIF